MCKEYEIKFELPIYYTFKFKTKKNKIQMIGLNWYNKAHFSKTAEVKKWYEAEVARLLSKYRDIRLDKFRVAYKLYYKNSASDGNNIVNCIDKFVVDGFKKIGMIIDDNVKHETGGEWDVIGQDRLNPRLECRVTGSVEETLFNM